jgi:anti-anti-sigma regulatory factor
MPVTLVQQEPHCQIRLDGRVTIASSAELKTLLLGWIATDKDLEVDLEEVEEIDLTVLQLLWAAEREAAEKGVGMLSRSSEAAALAARDTGFDRIPGARGTGAR